MDYKRDGFSPYFEVSLPIGEAALDIGLRYEHWNVDEGEDVNELIPRLSLNWESSSGKIWYLTAGRFSQCPVSTRYGTPYVVIKQNQTSI